MDESIPENLQIIQTRPLFVMRLQVKPVVVIGATPNGMRRVGLIAGGTFTGERLSGSALEGGSDWQTVRSDGATTLDVKLMLQSQEGDLIGMTYRGIRSGPPAVLAQIDRGEKVDPASYYFRISARFETAAPRYDWLNRLLCVGTGHRLPSGPIYSLFEIL